MKTISLWQPWASLMAIGLKKNETRHWHTKYRGPLLIHAAKRKPHKYEIDHIALSLIEHGLQNKFSFVGLPYGAIVCQVTLIDCQQVGDHNYISDNSLEGCLGNYSAGRYVWITSNLKKFDNPIPYKGSQGFFDVPYSLIESKDDLCPHCGTYCTGKTVFCTQQIRVEAN